MTLRICLAALIGFTLSACASTQEYPAEEDKKQPDAKFCETDERDRDQVEVCRQY